MLINRHFELALDDTYQVSCRTTACKTTRRKHLLPILKDRKETASCDSGKIKNNHKLCPVHISVPLCSSSCCNKLTKALTLAQNISAGKNKVNDTSAETKLYVLDFRIFYYPLE
jgi:hypothetical protein